MTPAPVSYPVTAPLINRGVATLDTSGGVSGSTFGDWFIHTQSIEAYYERTNVLDSTLSSVINVPESDNNYLAVHFTVKTIEEVVEDASFDGALWASQELAYNSSSTSGGWGVVGTIVTTSGGYYRRAAQKDAKGNITDTASTCIREGTVNLDPHTGEYDPTYDTSSTVHSGLHTLIGSMPRVCNTFMPSLVNI
jgi:hypothetical protein